MSEHLTSCRLDDTASAQNVVSSFLLLVVGAVVQIQRHAPLFESVHGKCHQRPIQRGLHSAGSLNPEVLADRFPCGI